MASKPETELPGLPHELADLDEIRAFGEPQAHLVHEAADQLGEDKTLWLVGEPGEHKNRTITEQEVGRGALRAVMRFGRLAALRANIAMLGVALLGSNVIMAAETPAAAAQPNRTEIISNPIQYEGHNLPCGDPALSNWGKHGNILMCTPDFGQYEPLPGGGMGRYAGAFPEYYSTDLIHWRFIGYPVTPQNYSWAALPPEGNWPGGEYWSASKLHHFGNNYEFYYATQMNPQEIAKAQRQYHEQLGPRTMALFVAYTKDPIHGPWHNQLLHVPGQYNHVRGNAADYTQADFMTAMSASTAVAKGSSLELSGGSIDPSAANDSQGRHIIAWAKQSHDLFTGELTPDGLHMYNAVHKIFTATMKYPWMCNPDSQGTHCVAEGPGIFYDKNTGLMVVLFNTASTWDASYKVAEAVSANPFSGYRVFSHPVLSSGNRLWSTGIGDAPSTGPDGQPILAFHVHTNPGRDKNELHRYLAIGNVNSSFDSDRQLWLPVSDMKGHIADAKEIKNGKIPIGEFTVNGDGKPTRKVTVHLP